LKVILAIAVLASACTLLIWILAQGRKESASNTQPNLIGEAPSPISTQRGERVIILDQARQLRSGISTTHLTSTSHHEKIQAYGRVLDLQSLVDLRKNLIDLRKNVVDARDNVSVTKAQVERAEVGLQASQKQYERLKALYEDNRNVSEKALQAGEVVWRSDEANAHSAEQSYHGAVEVLRTAGESLRVLEDTARQQWGSVLTGWLFDGSPDFERLLRQQDVLIQITLPSGATLSPVPGTAEVRTPGGALVSAQFVSPSPRTDPRIQGMSFLYLAPQQMALLSGMNVVAWMPVGSQVKGFFIPRAAIVWWQGKAWTYVRSHRDRFVRRVVSTETPAEDGYFVVKGFKTGEAIVEKGAQVLLSEESRSKARVGEED
jgi:hypothetical protein